MNKKLVQKIAQLYKNGDLSKNVAAELLKELDGGGEDIAIIGIGCKTPVSDDYNKLWDTLKNKRSHVKPCPRERIDLTSKYLGEAGKQEEMYHHGAFLADYGMFDYELFGLSKEEAVLMDPMQRVMLEVAYRAFEDGGYLGERHENDVTGVFIGANFTNKQFLNYLSLMGEANFETIMANWTSGIATRLSNYFDLRGISTVIENSCIASIMAISEACNLLRMGKLTTALVGTVSSILIPDKRISLNRVFAHDKDVVSKPYDDNPGGNYVGEGAAALLLKPLSLALEHGDKIHGVIKSSCVNNNGGTAEFIQSNAEMIGEVVKSALNEAKIHPDQIDYIEGEGYCEKLEQALEVIGLTKGFSKFTERKQYCALGAASTNIGYSEAAVGIFNAICCLLAIKHKQIPPIYCFDKPSDVFDLCNTPFYVNDNLRNWEVEEKRKRTAAIFTQGFGGGNGFTIIQEYVREDKKKEEENGQCLFVFSALSKESFKEYGKRYLTFLKDHCDEVDLSDISYTAAVKRRHYTPFRMAVIAASKEDLYNQLKGWCDNDLNTQTLYAGEVAPKNYSENKKAANSMEKIMETKDYYQAAKYYMEGYNLKFSNLFTLEEYKNIDLPLYPFNKSKCWIE